MVKGTRVLSTLPHSPEVLARTICYLLAVKVHTSAAPSSMSRATAAAVSQQAWCTRYPNSSSPIKLPRCTNSRTI